MAKEVLTSEESIAYLKAHQPIGCRDMYTSGILSEKGVDTYFSACMTLTLGSKYYSDEKEDTCYFVDPCIGVSLKDNLLLSILSLIYFILHFSPIYRIYKKYPMEGNRLKKVLLVSNFFKQYRVRFTEDTLINAEYICQQNYHYKDNFSTNKDRLLEAERLVKKYAKAKLVVTSRIHCALPCLGLRTPVIYTYDTNQGENSTCRLGGLKDVFNIMNWSDRGLVPEFPFSRRLSISNTIPNKRTWEKYRDLLVDKCSLFIQKEIF